MCPICGNNQFVATHMQILQDSYQGMVDADSRPAGPDQEAARLIGSQEGWIVKSSGKCTTCFVYGFGVFLMMLPSVFAYGQIDHSDGSYTSTQTFGKAISPITIIVGCALLFWWYKLWKKGGVPSLQDELRCNYSFLYYEKPVEGKEGPIKSLIFSDFKRYRQASGLEPCRAAVGAIVIVLILVAVMKVVFTTSNNCPSCHNDSQQ